MFVTAALDDVHRVHEPYCSEIGRPSVDPELMIRMLLVGYCYGSTFSRSDFKWDSRTSLFSPNNKVLHTTVREAERGVFRQHRHFCLRTIVSPDDASMVCRIAFWSTELIMARNRIQFQKGLSEARFQALYGDEEKCRALVISGRWPDGFVCSLR